MPKYRVTMQVTEEFSAVIEAPDEGTALAKMEELRVQGDADDYFQGTPAVTHDAERAAMAEEVDEEVTEAEAEDLRELFDWLVD